MDISTKEQMDKLLKGIITEKDVADFKKRYLCILPRNWGKKKALKKYLKV